MALCYDTLGSYSGQSKGLKILWFHCRVRLGVDKFHAHIVLSSSFVFKLPVYWLSDFKCRETETSSLCWLILQTPATQSRSSVWRTYHLLLSLMCICRKLDQRRARTAPPKTSNVGSRHPKWHLDHCGKCMHLLCFKTCLNCCKPNALMCGYMLLLFCRTSKNREGCPGRWLNVTQVFTPLPITSSASVIQNKNCRENGDNYLKPIIL